MNVSQNQQSGAQTRGRRGQFAADVWFLARPYFVSQEKWVACGLLAVLVTLSLSTIYISVLINHWNAAFYNALQRFDAAEFFRQLMIFLALTIANVVCAVYQGYINQMLQIRWRRWLTESFLSTWLKDQSYYRGVLLGTVSDNPDQRISEDVGLFVAYTLSMSLGIFNSAVTLVSFIAILWNLSGSLVLRLGSAGTITIPGYMVLAALLYASLGTWLALRIGAPLVQLNFDLRRREADFRLSMAQFHENAEAIALARGEPDEHLRFRERFAYIVHNTLAIMRRQKQLTWFTWVYGQLAGIFPILVAAPRYFAHEIMLGGLMQTAQAFNQVQGALSFIINSYPDIARWRSAVDRLTGFQGAMRDASALDGTDRRIEIVHSAQPALHVEHLDVDLPNGAPLLEALSFTVLPGHSLLITGPAGSGKTTLVRALAGVWPFGKGGVEIPGGSRQMVMPEKPYLPIGSLRHALTYPNIDPRRLSEDTAVDWQRTGIVERAGDMVQGDSSSRVIAGDRIPGDGELQRALELCGLAHLASRLDEEQHWSHHLSLDEQKCLAFARLLVHRPDLVFLDETTSGLDDETKTRLYRILRTELPNAIVITCGHKGLLQQLHDAQLELQQRNS